MKYGAKSYNLQAEHIMEYYAHNRGTRLPSYCRNSKMKNLDIPHITDTKPNHIDFIVKLQDATKSEAPQMPTYLVRSRQPYINTIKPRQHHFIPLMYEIPL